MHRTIAILAATVIALGVGAPAVLAAGTLPHDGRVLVSVNGPVDLPAGQHADVVVVANGNATIEGEVDTIVVANGNATLDGARMGTVIVINGNVTLGTGTIVEGDVRTFDGRVDQAPGAVVQGSVGGLEADIATLGLVLLPAFLLFLIGLALTAVVAALAVAAFAARQTRAAEALISRQPVQTIVAGLIGVVALPIIGILAIVTVVGAPVGLALLLVVLPAVAALGWIVAAIWIGDWTLIRTRGAVEPERPYRAAVIGVVLLGVAGLLPPISAIASLFGFGAVLLLAWRVLRHEPIEPVTTSSPAIAPPAA
jgi:hypothetical protein